MIVNGIGNERENNLVNFIDEGEGTMSENKIQKLMEQVEIYKQAVQDAKDALASAEMELTMALDIEFNGQ